MIKRVLITMPPEIEERMKDSAKAKGYSLSGFVRELYKDYLKRQPKTK